jgi:hypothetical protein
MLQDLHASMKMLGLNPMEQEIVDLTNTISRNGLIYFPDFCKIVLKRWREEDEEAFRQNMFKVLFPPIPNVLQIPLTSHSIYFIAHFMHDIAIGTNIT